MGNTQATVMDERFAEPDVLEEAPSNLKYAFIMFRHGLRAPYLHLPPQNIEEFKSTWPEGTGSLTPAGRRQMLHVGRSLRTRYLNVVAPEFDESRVQVTSTVLSRCTVSALLVAAGLFPATNPINLNIASEGRLKVVKHTAWYDKSRIFDQTMKNTKCPQFVNLRDSIIREEQTQKARWQSYYEEINSELERSFSMQNFIKSLDDLFWVWDTLDMMKLNSKPIPEWTDDLLPMMERLAHLRTWRHIYGAEEILLLFSGTMIHQMIEEMEESAREDDGAVRMHLHASHDINMCGVYWTLSLQETYYSKTGDTIVLELYRDNTVKFFRYSAMEDDVQKRFQQISLEPLCQSDPCTLDKLKTSLAASMVDKKGWEEKCNDFKLTPFRKEPEY